MVSEVDCARISLRVKMLDVSTNPDEMSTVERQLRALIGVVDPARAAMLDLHADDDALDDAAVRTAVDELRALAARRDGSRAARALDGIADALEARWFT